MGLRNIVSWAGVGRGLLIPDRTGLERVSGHVAPLSKRSKNHPD